MILRATFARRKSAPVDQPMEFELVEAWDEYCIDANPEGYQKAVEAALESWEDDLAKSVTVEIALSSDAVRRIGIALNHPVIRIKGDIA